MRKYIATFYQSISALKIFLLNDDDDDDVDVDDDDDDDDDNDAS